MTANTKKAMDFLRALTEQREAYQEYAEGEILPQFTPNDNVERKPPRHFVDSSYLFIRSFDADLGARPFSNQVFWVSPDIRVRPVSGVSGYTRELIPGQTYSISCVVRNRGDLAVPSAKVEFWIVDPTLGFDTRFATHLTLGSTPSTWVSAYASSTVEIPYVVPQSESGHKCLFARVFSFSPLDLPIDDFALDPTLDRHVGQLNLNIVSQGETFNFNLIHAPNADLGIQFVPMMQHEVFALRHPILADFSPIEDIPSDGWLHMTELTLSETDYRGIEIAPEENTLMVTTRNPFGLDAESQWKLRTHIKRLLAAGDSGATRSDEYHELVAKYRQVSSQWRQSRFTMRIPDLNLSPGQVAGIHIRAIDRIGNRRRFETLGGITLLVAG